MQRGLGRHALWISGASGTGKSCTARLIAAEIADELNVEELDASDLTPARLREIEREMQCRAIGRNSMMANEYIELCTNPPLKSKVCGPARDDDSVTGRPVPTLITRFEKASPSAAGCRHT